LEAAARKVLAASLYFVKRLSSSLAGGP